MLLRELVEIIGTLSMGELVEITQAVEDRRKEIIESTDHEIASREEEIKFAQTELEDLMEERKTVRAISKAIAIHEGDVTNLINSYKTENRSKDASHMGEREVCHG